MKLCFLYINRNIQPLWEISILITNLANYYLQADYHSGICDYFSGYECGLNIDNFNDIKVGDVIEGYQTVQVKKTL